LLFSQGNKCLDDKLGDVDKGLVYIVMNETQISRHFYNCDVTYVMTMHDSVQILEQHQFRK